VRGPRLAALFAALLMVVGMVSAHGLSIRGAFVDDDTSVHEAAIDAIAAAGITKGCNPPANTRFCPAMVVTRGQMAAFLARAEDLPPAGSDFFVDDSSSIFEDDINRIADAGITFGCNPPVNNRYCPNDPVTRGEMAAFMARALDLPDATRDYFTDDEGSTFESDINRIARAGITFGCNPPSNTAFCPNRNITRAEMASFLARGYALPEVILNLPLHHRDYVCSRNGLTCSANVIVSPDRRYRITEGWYQVLPYLPGEQSAFNGSGTRFELRINGQLVSVTQLGPTTNGSLITRQWRVVRPLGPGDSLQGRWIWNGVVVRTTTARLVSG
jgi:hypothetical protein